MCTRYPWTFGSNVPGKVGEVVGEGGVLVAPLDIEEWSRAIVALWTQPEQRQILRQQALEQAARFSWQKTARQTWAVYQQLAGYKRR